MDFLHSEPKVYSRKRLDIRGIFFIDYHRLHDRANKDFDQKIYVLSDDID